MTARRPTIQERFDDFHRANPHVLEQLRLLALDLADDGERIGMKMLFEVLRYQRRVQTTGDSGFRLNNDFTPLYARMLMDQEPRLAGRFEVRELHAPAPIPEAPQYTYSPSTGQGALV